jgi:hypothetical protein
MATTNKEMFLTDQALGAVMVALQKSLFEQSDIVPMLKGFKFHLSEDGLTVLNPPIWKISADNTAETEAENA